MAIISTICSNDTTYITVETTTLNRTGTKCGQAPAMTTGPHGHLTASNWKIDSIKSETHSKFRVKKMYPRVTAVRATNTRGAL